MPSAESLESLACRLRGVYGCRVEMEAGRSVPARVDVTVDISRRTAVARDLQSAFYAAFGVMVPLDRIAVTSVRRPAGSGAPAAGGGRLGITTIRCEEVAGSLRVSVSLCQHDQEATGVAEAGSWADRLRAAAEAALAAVAVARGWPEPASLEDVAVVPTGSHRAVLVRLRVGGGEAGLRLGAALVRRDAAEAAVRAALAAVNRFEPEGRFPLGSELGRAAWPED